MCMHIIRAEKGWSCLRLSNRNYLRLSRTTPLLCRPVPLVKEDSAGLSIIGGTIYICH